MSDRLEEIKQRLLMCAEVVQSEPYRHPVATGWYADDVRWLLERAERAEMDAELLAARLRPFVEPCFHGPIKDGCFCAVCDARDVLAGRDSATVTEDAG